ncbi:replication initiator protein A [Butyrivibrio sp.]|uniref:replication initiator protein A n=1 Tax=Butyrivibrio sp. TaxID=28121 RepID=UPI0025C5C753|nr:replication initiator protein A [Butyrivibrio sp.]MBQ9303848.1 replication initiator protein A [Butyrivibrio sp.]
MKLDYHYGRQAMQYAMVEIPLLMFLDDAFEPLSIEAKVVYGILLQRIKLAGRNGWRDEEGKLYVIYPLEQMRKDIGLSTKVISAGLKQLEEIGIIDIVVRGQGKPNIIYVKNFIYKDEESSFRDAKIASLK